MKIARAVLGLLSIAASASAGSWAGGAAAQVSGVRATHIDSSVRPQEFRVTLW